MKKDQFNTSFETRPAHPTVNDGIAPQAVFNPSDSCPLVFIRGFLLHRWLRGMGLGQNRSRRDNRPKTIVSTLGWCGIKARPERMAELAERSPSAMGAEQFQSSLWGGSSSMSSRR